jgi:hypothetical protein
MTQEYVMDSLIVPLSYIHIACNTLVNKNKKVCACTELVMYRYSFSAHIKHVLHIPKTRHAYFDSIYCVINYPVSLNETVEYLTNITKSDMRWTIDEISVYVNNIIENMEIYRDYETGKIGNLPPTVKDWVTHFMDLHENLKDTAFFNFIIENVLNENWMDFCFC